MDRWEALEKGFTTFDSLQPCPRCGGTTRYAKKLHCADCHKEKMVDKGSPRKRAVSRGEVTYMTGKACPKGHIAPRYTSTGSCSLCVNPPKATKTVRVPNVHPQDVHALLAYATALSLARF